MIAPTEVSDVERRMRSVHHPWRLLREHLPEWDVLWRLLPDGVLAGSDADLKVIVLDPTQSQRQKRCSLDHELVHAEAGDAGPQGAKREAWVARKSARRMIPLAKLLEAVVWAHDLEELAEELWVDTATVQCRLDSLTDPERAAVRTALAIRDFHEEGMP